ncbi:Uncharacterized protein TPAR_01797 [Tolypocladium paradoxum]|uniref:Uncharacterized protein n=1 Tax=Tolypocladium paradoxum TaxID=94208 RepID=A0A2S4L6C6_9HYPO|nr:Uncharacterized protein TPAR_01797 [Tolypocladium paradoxum]
MDSTRGSNSHHAAAGKQMAQNEPSEQLLDVFKAAALSVTKLYKTSAMTETRARSEGYQECLDDLLTFLDKENLGLRDGEGWKIRAWATERFDGRDAAFQNTESEDEAERRDRTNSPELTRTSTEPQMPAQQRTAEAPISNVAPIAEEPPRIVVPTQENFTFQSSHPYPNIATLDLSDARTHDGSSLHASRSSKGRLNGSKSGSRTSGHLGRGAGAKRRWDFDDFFGGCLGGKDPFGGGGKRSRHT